MCGGGESLLDRNTLKKACQPDSFLDVCPAGKPVAVQTTPPEALGMCDVQHSQCSCLAWSLPPATVRDAGGGGRSLIPILLVCARLLHWAFHRSAWLGQRERWGGGAELLGVEESGSMEGKGDDRVVEMDAGRKRR